MKKPSTAQRRATLGDIQSVRDLIVSRASLKARNGANNNRYAPTEMDIVERLSAGLYPSAYALLRDLVWNLSWSNRYALQYYDKRPTAKKDIPRDNKYVFFPVYTPWNGDELSDIIVEGYQWLMPTWDEETEDALFQHLISLFRHKPGCGGELDPLKPGVNETMASGHNLVMAIQNHSKHRLFTAMDIASASHPVPELQEVMWQTMLLGNQYPWDVTSSRLVRVDSIRHDDHVVLFYPKDDKALSQIKQLMGTDAVH